MLGEDLFPTVERTLEIARDPGFQGGKMQLFAFAGALNCSACGARGLACGRDLGLIEARITSYNVCYTKLLR